MDGYVESFTKTSDCKTHLKQAINIAKIGLWTYNPKTQTPAWSNQMYHIFGIPIEQGPPSYDQHKEFIHPDDWNIFDDAVQKAITDGTGYHLKLRLVRYDNSIRWIITKSEVIKNDRGEVVKLIGSVIDITDEKELQQNLHSSEFKFKNIFDNAINGILIANDDAEYVYANQAICDMTGYSHDELLSKTLMDITPLPHHVNGKELFQEFIKQGKQTGEYQIKKKDGTMITAEYRAVANVAPGLHVSILNDITDKKKNEEERKKLDMKLKLAMKSAHEGLWEWDLTNDKVFFDKVALGMLGFSSENISDDMKKGSWWMQQVHPDDKEEMQKRFNQYISGELDEYVSEFRLKNKDGGYTWIYSSGLIIDHDENGKSKGIIGIHRDITERKRIEKQIKESETRYRSLFENMGNAVAVYKAVDNGNDFIFVDFNKTAEKTEKISKEDLIGKRVTEVFPGVKEFGLLDVLKEVWKSGNAKELPASYYQDSNITGWRKSFVYKLPTDEIIAVYDDITNRIEMINAIREAKERLDILFEYAPDAIYLLDSNGVFLQWNKTAEMITGYSRREAIGKKFTDLKLVQRKYLPKALKNLAKSKLGFPTGPDEYELIKKDGSSVFTEISTYPVNIKNETVIMGIARDITKRLESERLLEENEARYRMLFNSSNDAIFLIDQNETIVDCNIKASEMFNFKKRSIINNTLHDFFLRTQADGQSLYDIVERRISDVFDGKEQKFEWVQKNNRSETFYADVQLNRIFINDRFIVQAVITDTTNMKKKQKIENRLASIVRYTEDAIISKNLDGMITSWNRGAELLYGYKQDEVIGRYISLIVPENKMDELHKIMRTAKEGKILSNFETKRKRKNGSLIDVSLTISPIKDKKGTVTGISSIGHNITDRKITTKKLRETRDKLKEMNENLEKIVEDRTKQVNQLLEQKDEYIRMLGHDLKNPLGPLLNLLPIVRNKVDDKDVKKMIDISLNNVNKLKKLLYHTIEQAKKDSLGLDLNLEEIQLSSIVNNVIESRRQFFTSLEFKILNHVDDSFIVMTDKIRLTEVFDNLISNSIKYSNGKNPEIIIDAVVEETHLKVSVSDNGRGIASEDLDHVFDQFYHKGSSNGILESHGLGLAICRKIIEKHGGSIWVESEGFGKGSTFYFTLPIPEKKEKRIINEHHRTS